MTSLDPDWQFYLLLAATAIAVLAVVAVYSVLTYRRNVAAGVRREARERAGVLSEKREPVFFRRWEP